jgi:hypothetical protein
LADSNRPGPPLIRDEKASTVAAIRAFTNLWAAAHPVDQRVAVNAVPVAEFLKLLEINVIGQHAL